MLSYKYEVNEDLQGEKKMIKLYRVGRVKDAVLVKCFSDITDAVRAWEKENDKIFEREVAKFERKSKKYQERNEHPENWRKTWRGYSELPIESPTDGKMLKFRWIEVDGIPLDFDSCDRI